LWGVKYSPGLEPPVSSGWAEDADAKVNVSHVKNKKVFLNPGRKTIDDSRYWALIFPKGPGRLFDGETAPLGKVYIMMVDCIGF